MVSVPVPSVWGGGSLNWFAVFLGAWILRLDMGASLSLMMPS